MSTEIRNEDDFQAYLMKKYGYSFGFNLYPKIRRIAGDPISPEIDLLDVNQREKVIKGYEFKILNCKTRDANYRRIREGIGQAILYFQYGVDVSYIVFGLSNNIPIKIRWTWVMTRLDDTLRVIRRIKENYNLNCLGVMLWIEERDSFGVVDGLKPEGKFPINRYNDYKLNKECLFDLRFDWDKKFLEKYGLKKPK